MFLGFLLLLRKCIKMAVVYTGFCGCGWGTGSNVGLVYIGKLRNLAFFKLERLQEIFKIKEKFIIFDNFKGTFARF